MPELPEVEYAKRTLEGWFAGRSLVRTEGDRKLHTFRDSDFSVFCALKGTLRHIERRGKYLIISFSNHLGFIGHLGMTGRFLKREPADVVRWSRARFFLDSGEVIHFQDPRMLGFIDAAPNSELKSRPSVAKLGIDPLVDEPFDVTALRGALADSKQPIKVALMNQERVAGLGNIHAAEALFRSKLHPTRVPASLTAAEWKALHRGILGTIHFALEMDSGLDEIVYVSDGGGPNPFLIYGRAGQRCTHCGTTVESFVQAARTTHFCPGCQPVRPTRSHP
jgi:formamidopyrimidine-DNA glycosylase